MIIKDATFKDVLAVDPTLSNFDVEDVLTLGNPHDTIEDTILKLNGAPCGECATI
jgi:hypothetical protein